MSICKPCLRSLLSRSSVMSCWRYHPQLNKPESAIIKQNNTPLQSRKSLETTRWAAHYLPARRRFSTTPTVQHGHLTPPKPGEERHVTFIDKDGKTEQTFVCADGDNLLDLAQANDIDLEGACGGSCACSTCHLIVQQPELYDLIPEPDDDENDMLDMAFGCTETSRLGCQVKMAPELDGLRVRLPSHTRNIEAETFKSRGAGAG
ncbi:ferredoxin [Patellaria atrata CBS 101060]|uniref:Ferredoxin n=1 Tax=Patellaria atrata CBS 101060 TaxID=1346257 RepID=A0A9P4VTD1_9PEZI|nr:ferredoxin [Patellaria atrata CBS 101060]